LKKTLIDKKKTQTWELIERPRTQFGIVYRNIESNFAHWWSYLGLGIVGCAFVRLGNWFGAKPSAGLGDLEGDPHGVGTQFW